MFFRHQPKATTPPQDKRPNSKPVPFSIAFNTSIGGLAAAPFTWFAYCALKQKHSEIKLITMCERSGRLNFKG